MELQQFHSSSRVRTQYFKALAKLSEQLNETWKQVFPPDARQPRETCEAFFEPFAQFSVALYDAYAEELLDSNPSQEQYLQALNFDLKTLVCNQIYSYRENPIRTLQDAIDADARGELPDEWTVCMGEAWRLFEHPGHSASHDRVCREFINVYGHMPELWSRLIGRIHKAISRRVIHWLAAHAERVEALAEAATIVPPVTRAAADPVQPERAGDAAPKADEAAPSQPATGPNAETVKRRRGMLKQYLDGHDSLTMPDLARRATTSVTAIYGMVRGDRSRYAKETLARFLKTMGVSPEQW